MGRASVGIDVHCFFKKTFLLIFKNWLVYVYLKVLIQINSIETNVFNDSHEGITEISFQVGPFS